MPQRISPNSEGSGMTTFFKTIFVIGSVLAAFAGGYYTANKGIRIVNSDGTAVVMSNAAQTVKNENSNLGKEVVGKSESEAEKVLLNNHRTMFVGVRDGVVQENKSQKTFTNLTVEVKEGKVVKVLGWY